MRRTIRLLAGLTCAIAAAAYADTIYVNDATGNDAWDGRCEVWNGGTCGPKKTIQAGIDVAEDEDDVVLASGLYSGPNNRGLVIGRNGVTVRSANGPETCIIDCETADRAFIFNDGEDRAVTIEGLTIVNGFSGRGGGIYCGAGTGVTIRHCVVRNCEARFSGGAIEAMAARLEVVESVIEGNATRDDGAGINAWNGSTLVVRDCTITANSSTEGSGISLSGGSDGIVTRTTVTKNTSTSNGTANGAINADRSGLTVVDCMVSENFAGGISFPFATRAVVVGSKIRDNHNVGINAVAAFDLDISDCLVSGNLSTGIRCWNNGSIRRCTIEGNSGARDGGGVYVASRGTVIEDCLIINNTAAECGGGVYFGNDSHPTLRNCVIADNSAQRLGGGGIFLGARARPTIVDCQILDNVAGEWGGGFYLSLSDPLVINCRIERNTARQSGGGVYGLASDGTFVNCIVTENRARNGGGVFLWGETLFSLCTIARNTAERNGGGVCCFGNADSILADSIVWENAATQGFQLALMRQSMVGSRLTVSSCDIQGGPDAVLVQPFCELNWGKGNIDADPHFVDLEGGDVHLLPDSPCIDAGDPGFVAEPGLTDMDRQMRVWDGDGDGMARVDMGADEFGSFAFGDMNCDGVINRSDIEAFLLALFDPVAYEVRFPDCDRILADLNFDGQADALDIEGFLGLLFP